MYPPSVPRLSTPVSKRGSTTKKSKVSPRSFYHALSSAHRPGFVPDNRVTLLHNGADYFPAIEAAFDRARHEIYLATYIFHNDATGQRVADALKRAAQRGVKVYVLIDGFGSKDLPPGVMEDLRAEGVNTLVFKPKISPWTLRRKRLRRMHRKIVVVDREIAFVGGINIIADRETAGEAPRFDFAVSVEGPLVDVIRLSSQRLWSLVAWRALRKGTVRVAKQPPSPSTDGVMNAAFLMRDNFHHRRDIESAYMRAIEGAESEIIVAHAYFLPGVSFRHALVDAAGRGVRVILLLQGKVEFLLEYHASRALYGTFLDAGIEIYEYRKSFLHAKVAVIDGHWSTVGSSNIDPFSLLLSREANVVVADDIFGATLAQSLKRTVDSDGQQIVADDWTRQSVVKRILGWLSYDLLRLMMAISGYEPECGRARNG